MYVYVCLFKRSIIFIIPTLNRVFFVNEDNKIYPEHQEEIMSDSWKYWNMTLDELIDKFVE
jgi:hypothetical protein